MSGVNFEDILGMTFFILMIWFVGRIFKAGNCSPIVGEIFVGVALGPNGLDIVPLFNDEDCAGTTFWQMAGQIGVTLLIAESGIHVEFAMLKKVGGKAFAVACVGTFLPIITGVLFGWMLGLGAYPNGFALGSSL
eukprot:gene28734-35662_t